MASSSTRRIFPIADWAPAHEALYSDADNDSSIDTLPFPTKPGESSASASVAAPTRRSTTKKHRSMSLSWRPKSTALPPGHLEPRLRDLSLQRSRTVQLQTEEPLSVQAALSPQERRNTGKAEDGTPNSAHNNKGKAKAKRSMSGMWRRASVQLKGIVHRRTSLATDTLEDPHEIMSKRQLRSSHAPSRSHHLFPGTDDNGGSSSSNNNDINTITPASPSSPATCTPPSPRSGLPQHQQPARPTTSHTINATWHRLRNATSFSRHSRIFYPDVSLPPHDQPQLPADDLPQSVPRPGLGNEPPVIPRNTGSGARAAVAAWQHEMFPGCSPLKNKRLTLDSAQNDHESGIGIAVTSTDSVDDDLHDLDMVTPEGDVVLGACAPNRVDFVGRLPVELAIQVLAHLDAAGLATASRVSNTWRDIASLQHVWRESYLRDKTGTYATSEPIEPGTGLGVPAVRPGIDWKSTYRATEELAKRWRQGKATSIHLNGHSDSIYCLQFDEYVLP